MTRSSEILPEIREYERTSTAVVNAYVGPAITRYLGSLVDRLREAGIGAQLEVMQSSGGTLTPETARRKPAHLVESGPAAGVMACSYLGRLTGRRHLISLDMGGTTAKAAIVEDGQPVRTSEYEVGAGINLSSKLVKGGGHPIKLPFIDVSEIGAGGGSIVAIDELGNVTVGPVSAGSDPGAGLLRARRRGADARPTRCSRSATSTPRQLGGGAITLDPAPLARGARPRRRDAARPVGRGGRLRHPDARRRHDDARRQGGHHLPRPRPARLHALRVRRQRPADRRRDRPLARDVHTCSIPPSPGVFSALGLLFSDTEHEVVRTLMLRGDEITAAALEAAFAEIEAETTAYLAGTAGATVTVSRYADVRYAGQAYELSVAVPPGPVDVERLVADFVAEHVRTYGHGSADDPVDVVSIRALARIERTSAQLYDPLAAIRALPVYEGTRLAYFGPDVGLIETERLQPGRPARRRAARPAPRRRGRLDLRRPAGLPGPARPVRQHRGRARCLRRASTRSPSRWSRTRSRRPPTRWRS